MADNSKQEIVHTHRYESKDCSKGHRWLVKFKREGNVLAWIKVCKRCPVVWEDCRVFRDANWERPVNGENLT